MNSNHRPVMLAEAIEALQITPNDWYVDATFGRGGHTREILSRRGKVVAFDYDQVAINAGQTAFADEIQQGRLILQRENFDQLTKLIAQLRKSGQVDNIGGILFDFGTSSEQLTSTQRGLSFQGEDEELDMRLDNRLGVSAKDLLAVLGEQQLTQMFQEWGGEWDARRIAKEIVYLRNHGKFITTVGELVHLVEKVKQRTGGKIHPATKVFQALRIAVNDELSNIERALPQALEILTPGGIIVTIAFHEGEDRIAKQLFKEWEKEQQGTTNKKPLVPSQKEVSTNPRARSAKLRTFVKK